MKKLKLRLVLLGLVVLIHSCTSNKKAIEDDEFGTDAAEVSADSSAPDSELSLDDAQKPSVAANGEAGKDEFAEFGADSAAPEANANPPVAVQSGSSEDTLESELNNLEDKPAAVAQAPAAPSVPTEELSLDDPALAEQTPAAPFAPADVTAPPPQLAIEAPLALPEEPTPPPAVEVPQIAAQEPVVEPPPIPMAPKISQINSVQYQSNQSGGTIVINSDEPLQFTTRSNPATHQLVIEVQNSVVPKKLKRSLNTKDMASSIGSVDIYQKPNSNISRFVVQLRPGSPEPLVQPEGTSLLIVGAANPTYARKNETTSQGSNGSIAAGGSNDGSPQASVTAHQTTGSQDANPDLTSEGIMNSQTLEDFLASNNKFYGKKISIEAVKLDINDAFKFLAEESGVNMIIDEGVTGDVTVKLRQVPWDQAFVLLLKSKKLGYKRQGNVIRIGAVANLQKEEEDAIKLMESRKSSEPLVVKRFFIGYADIGELEKKIKDFISTTVLTATGSLATTPSRGKVISDARTSSLIVTETPDNMLKIEKLVAALDTQPKQVLIEGKVIEASERFTRDIGVAWGSDTPPSGNMIRPSVSFAGGDATTGAFKPKVSIGLPGSPGDFGNLTAALSLNEKEDKLRVLSSPRISVLSSQSATISQTVNTQIKKLSTDTASAGTTTTTYETVPVGVTLTVTPQVSNEGTVVMDLSIERSFLSGALNADIEKRNAKTKVIVRSGQTAVIGGIFQADATDSAVGIPFLKDIPFFGVLFKGSSKIRTKNELVIFVTPRIQKTVKGDSTSVSKFE
ncbi:MAG: type IV pilus secretin PilQ [Bdellovibrio sp.]|nr:type IV pilus secretin PilQ [Bdellovibrio sp.]